MGIDIPNSCVQKWDQILDFVTLRGRHLCKSRCQSLHPMRMTLLTLVSPVAVISENRKPLFFHLFLLPSSCYVIHNLLAQILSTIRCQESGPNGIQFSPSVFTPNSLPPMQQAMIAYAESPNRTQDRTSIARAYALRTGLCPRPWAHAHPTHGSGKRCYG